MNNKQIATYLNNHLAGSVTVLNLLAHLESVYAKTEIAHFSAELYADIAADRAALETVMTELQITKSPIRQTIAWFAEKLNQLQLRLDDSAEGALQLLEALEVVAAGLAGKHCLWRTLQVVATEQPEYRVTDYAHLIQRSETQQRRLEETRITVVKQALTAAARA